MMQPILSEPKVSIKLNQKQTVAFRYRQSKARSQNPKNTKNASKFNCSNILRFASKFTHARQRVLEHEDFLDRFPESVQRHRY